MPKDKTKKDAKKKSSVKKSGQAKKSAAKISPAKHPQPSVSERLKLNESYMSLILGALVVIFLIAFLLVVLGSKKAVNEIEARITPTPSVGPKAALQKTYVLGQDEDLWDVAVKFYGDGTKWTIISEANHFDYPDYVQPGTTLIIPNP